MVEDYDHCRLLEHGVMCLETKLRDSLDRRIACDQELGASLGNIVRSILKQTSMGLGKWLSG